MAQVVVNIAGRPYRMACEDGEEDRLGGLARLLDEKITSMREIFGEIGDQRLIVMSAIAIADELTESQQKLADTLAELKNVRMDSSNEEQRMALNAHELASALDQASERLERLAKSIGSLAREA